MPRTGPPLPPRLFIPMRVALISDVHSNVHALEQVLARLDHAGVDLILNLGDLVGYNANPNECMELLQTRNVLSLAGNHDLALLNVELAQHFNIIAYQAIVWAQSEVRPEYREFLENLPLTREVHGYLACHGTPTSADTYISYHFQGKRVFKHMSKQAKLKVCFFGHTHRRALWYRDVRGTVSSREITQPKVMLAREGHYLINPGSVGQPRDGSPEAAYAIFDGEEYSIHFKSVPYDLAGAQRRILKAGLAPFLAERLALGK